MTNKMLCGVALACLLAGCGSGDDNSPAGPTAPGATPTPTPAPTPTPSPSPTPTPVASYTRFADLTGTRDFRSACSALQYSGTPPVALDASDYDEGPLIHFDTAAQSYSLAFGGRSLSFGPNDLVAAPPANTIAYAKPAANGQFDRFALITPVAGAAGLVYTRLVSIVSTAAPPLVAPCIIGVPTLITDVPGAGTIAFSKTAVAGSSVLKPSNNAAYASYTLSQSTATFSVNAATGEITGTLVITATPTAGGDSVALGTFTLSDVELDDIDDTVNQFYGELKAANGQVVGYVGGAFFGPQGAEFGFSYNLTVRDATNAVSAVAVGAAFGSR